MSPPTLARVLERADQASARLQRLQRPLELCAFTCSYDTAFEPVAHQTEQKLAELARVFPPDGPVRASLVVVDDAGRPSFADDVRRGFAASAFPADRLVVEPLRTGAPGPWGRRGLATREALLHALARAPDAVLHVNLNLKVHAAQAATGLALLLDRGAHAVIGSRARHDGGDQSGAGVVGRGKSLVFNHLVRGALPELAGYRDVGSPMKVLSPAAAREIARRARLDDVAFESEWLAILAAQGFLVERFGILWQQRRGSRPPLERSLHILGDVRRVRRARRRGVLS